MQLNIKRIAVGPIRTNCYIINRTGSDKAIIVDPGDEADKIKRELGFSSLTPVAILLTHGHFDHIGAVSELRKYYGIKVYA